MRQAGGHAGRVQIAVRQHQDSLNAVAQLADVAGPGVTFEDVDGFGKEAALLPAVRFANALSKVLRQLGNVSGELTQRRQLGIDLERARKRKSHVGG